MNPENIKLIVKEKYGKIAEQNSQSGSCCCGSSCCGSGPELTTFSDSYESREGYNSEADLSLGCGIPTDFADIRQGDHVLDLGSGAGNDCFVARALVGEYGKVTGLDLTEQMVAKARENCEKLNYSNVDFFIGDIESMPFSENIFDVVISNCVLNLVPDKSKAFNEIFRVLKTGGHFCVSDVVIKGRLSEKMKQDAELYAGCVSGASEMDEYLKFIEEAGFSGIKVHKQKKINVPDSLLPESDMPDGLDKVETGIYSITVSAEKPI